MNDKHKLFADDYLIHRNGTRAAENVGYSKKTARSIACELLTKPDIKKYIAEKTQTISDKLGITQEYVLGGVKNIADITAKIGEYFDPKSANKSFEMLGKHLKLWQEDDKNKQATNITIQLTQF